MELQQLEARVLGIVESALVGHQTEDGRVELKSRWPQAGHRAARQIAGLANAAGGDDILWIIGIDESKCRLEQLEQIEPSNWWSETRRWFDEEPPILVHSLSIAVPGGGRVMALLFGTARTPYLVSAPQGGQVQREVPWREGNSTRSAHRHEILRAIVEQVRAPSLQVQECWAVLQQHVGSDPYHPNRDEFGRTTTPYRVDVSLRFLLSASTKAYLPEYGQSLSLDTSTTGSLEIETFALRGPYRLDGHAALGGQRRVPAGDIEVLAKSGLSVSGSGEVSLEAQLYLNEEQGAALERARNLTVKLVMPVDQSRHPAQLSAQLRYKSGTREDPKSRDEWATYVVRSRFELLPA